jgi:hypothetical protein
MNGEGTAKYMAWATETVNMSTASSADVSLFGEDKS